MNYKQILLAASVACAALVGCEPEIERAANEFFYPSSFEVDTVRMWYGYDFALRFTNIAEYSPSKGGRSKERYKQYVYYFGDFGYREEGCWGDSDDINNWPSSCCVCDIMSIHVATQEDFDEAHPAGSYIDDLMVVRLESAYPFIKSNYKLDGYDYNYRENRPDNEFYLNEVNPDYLKLNGHCFAYLNFLKSPSVKGEHTFIITVEMGADPVSGYVPDFKPQEITVSF